MPKLYPCSPAPRRAALLAALLLALAAAPPARAQAELDKLTASDPGTSDIFGYAVAVSGDLAVVGAYLDDTAGGSNAGSAYVYRRTGAEWVHVAKLTASDAAASDEFGWSVAVSGDLAVVGARYDDDGGLDSGSAYVFDLAACGAACTETAKLTASDAATGDLFGWSVAVSGDLAVVGAYGDDDGGGSTGSAYVFALTDAIVTAEPVDGGGDPVPEPVLVPAAGPTEVPYTSTFWNNTPDPLAVHGWPVITRTARRSSAAAPPSTCSPAASRSTTAARSTCSTRSRRGRTCSRTTSATILRTGGRRTRSCSRRTAPR